MNIILYSQDNCPKCKIIKSKLHAINIQYQECQDKAKMKDLGLTYTPAILINDKLITDFTNINKVINLLKNILESGQVLDAIPSDFYKEVINNE